MTSRLPQHNEIWIDENRQPYKVMFVTNLASRRKDLHPPQVVYKSEDLRLLSAPLNWWYGRMTLLLEAPEQTEEATNP